jgi:hypothetical protein
MIPQHSLPGGRYPLPGPDFHRLDRASFAWRTQTAFTENFASPIQLTAATLALSSLTAGAKFPITTVPEGVLRYLRLNYTVAGSTPTVGKITAGVGVESVHQDTAIYPDAL